MVEQKEVVKQRKVYCKPFVERIRLVSQESVLAACKYEDSGPNGTGANCVDSNCVLDNGAS